MDDPMKGPVDMPQRIIDLETQLGCVIDPMPFDFSEFDRRRWKITTDRDGQLHVKHAHQLLGDWARSVGGAIIAMAIIVIVTSFITQEGTTAQGRVILTGVGVAGVLLGMACMVAGGAGKPKDVGFRINPRERTITHSAPFQTTGPESPGHCISLDRIAGVQLCAMVNRLTWVRQLNLILNDPPGQRVKLLEISYEGGRLIRIALEVAEIMDVPIIVHEAENIVEPVGFAMPGGVQLRSHVGKRKRKKRDLSHLPEVDRERERQKKEALRGKIVIKPRTKANDFLTAFDDILYPDDEAEQ